MNGRLLVALVLALALVGAAAWFLGFRGSVRGPQVARENPCDVFPSLDGALAGWMQQQRAIEPALTCEHFEKILDTTPAVGLGTPWQDLHGFVKTGAPHWRSPDQVQMLEPSASGLALIDLARGTRRVLLSGGSGETWTDAGWMDRQSFVAASTVTAQGMQTPMLTVFRLDANRMSVFRGPTSPVR